MPDDVNIVEPEEVVLSVDDQDSVSMSATDVEVVDLQTEQAQIIEAISPEADVSKVEEGAKITVTDYRGTTETVIGYDDISSSLVDKAIENYLPTDTAEDAVASFTDGAAMPVKSMVVDIEPVQDLHGYDSPWPAGGGKNLVDIDSVLVDSTLSPIFSVDDNGRITINGTITTTSFARVPISIAPGTYTMSANNSQANGSVQFSLRNEDLSLNSGWKSFSVLNATITFDVIQAASYVQIQVNGGTYTNFEFHLQLEKGSTATSWTPYSNVCPITGWDSVNVCVSPTINAEDGQTYTIAFPASAGTVYGGTLDVTNGKLTVNRYFVGQTTWRRYDASNGYVAYRIDNLPYGRYRNDKSNKPVSNIISNFGSFTTSNIDRNIIQPPRDNLNSAFLALQEDLDPVAIGLQLVYLMRDPIIYQLEPHEVTTLLGANNIWADAGDVAVDYRADIRLYIDKKISESLANIN